jgi:hypothetical protein
MGKGDTLLNAVLGAVVTVVLSFTGFSPILGGGVAGYLQRETRRDGAVVGAISGALATIPFLFLIVVGFGFLLAGPLMAGGFGLPGGVELLIVVFVMFPLLLLWNGVLGAAGGYVGTYVYEEYGPLESRSRDSSA